MRIICLFKKCDLLVTIVPTASRAEILAFTYPTIYTAITYMIPKPVLIFGVTTIANPFGNIVRFCIIIGK